MPVRNSQQNPGRDAKGQFRPGSEEARLAGQRGGQQSGGNFANNPERAREAGRKGGKASSMSHRNLPLSDNQASRTSEANVTTDMEDDNVNEETNMNADEMNLDDMDASWSRPHRSPSNSSRVDSSRDH